MHIIYNGQKTAIDSTALLDFLHQHNITIDTIGIAIAHNHTLLPKSQWGACTLKDNDVLEIVKPFQGG